MKTAVLLLLALLSVHLAAFGQRYQFLDQINFEVLTVREGLPQNLVTSVMRSRDGFMWFGTREGLTRYDSHQFVVYKNSDSPQSISHNYVTAVLEDRQGHIWVGTEDGLNRFNPVTEQFFRYRNNPRSSRSLSNNNVTCLYEDAEGTIWVGTVAGLNRLVQADSGYFDFFVKESDNHHSIPSNTIRDIQAASMHPGKLWIGTTGGGLSLLDPSNKTFTAASLPTAIGSGFSTIWKIYEDPSDSSNTLWLGSPSGLCAWDQRRHTSVIYRNDPLNPQSMSNNRVRSILRTRQGALLVGTTEGGINILGPDDKFHNLYNNPTKLELFSDDYIYAMVQTSDDIIWVCTYSSGIMKITPQEARFYHYRRNAADPQSLAHNVVRSFIEDRNGQIWVATDMGFDLWDRESRRFIHHRNDVRNANSLVDDHLHVMVEDPAHRIWLGAHLRGLDRFDPATNSFKHYSPQIIRTQRVLSLHTGSDHYLWIGTYRNGLCRLDLRNDSVRVFGLRPADQTEFSTDGITAIHEDADGLIWIGTSRNGIYVFDRKQQTFAAISKSSDADNGLTDNHIYCIFEDRSGGTIWIGTAGGLNRIDRKTRRLWHITESDGLPNNVVYGILQDQSGFLWLSTNMGITRMSFAEGQRPSFTYYTDQDGLQSNQFEANACLMTRDGELLFGGINGFNIFRPDRIAKNNTPPKVVLTGFRIFDQPVMRDTSITMTQRVELDYDQNFFSFEFAALNFHVSAKNEYAYRLEGFDDNWHYRSARKRSANYTNVPPGTYRFHVKASNNDRVWNEQGAAVTITIRPPFWATWWFRGGVFILIVASIIIVYNMRVRGIQEMNRRLEGLVMERTQALNQKKNELQKAHDQLEIRVDERTQQLRDLSDHLIHVREEERTRISREVHDELGQQLTALKMDLSWVIKRTTDDAAIHDKTTTMSGLIDSTIKSVQRIASDLRPGLLDDLGLSAAIEWQAGEFEKRSGITCKCCLTQDEFRISNDQATAFFRIFQETLTNVLRHAAATEVQISLFVENMHLCLVIKDNGKGITKVQRSSPHSLGLIGMKERIHALRGTIDIFGEPGEGTSVRVAAPLSPPL